MARDGDGSALKTPLIKRVPHRRYRIIHSDLRTSSSDAAAHGDEEASSFNLHTNIYTYTADTYNLNSQLVLILVSTRLRNPEDHSPIYQ